MNYFVNSINANFEKLEEHGYPSNLIQALKNENYEYLKRIEFRDQINDPNFMLPILNAVKKEKGTYIIYRFLGDNLKQNEEVAALVVASEPELIDGTTASNNPELIKKLATYNPEVIRHMSKSLKSNREFIDELSKLNINKIDECINKECGSLIAIIKNPELANNVTFMKEALKENATLLAHAPEDLKNNYEFIREASMENREVINYVVEHTEEFGKEALDGASDSLEEHFKNDVNEKIIEEMKKLESKKIDFAEADKIPSDESKCEKNEEKVRLERIQRSVERHFERYERYKSEVEEGKRDPQDLVKYIDRIMGLGTNLPEDIKVTMEQDKKLLEAKIKRIEKNKAKFEPKDIEEASKGRTLSDIQKEPDAVRTTIEEQTKENNDKKQTLEEPQQNEEIGE